VASLIYDLRITERERRSRFGSRLERAADAYLVRRGEGQTIIAGYPWFTDWGRDTFISMRGSCSSPERAETALQIVLAWCETVSEGMLPNRFPDVGAEPEYNSVDASLWFVVAACELISRHSPDPAALARIRGAIEEILTGYSRGTRFGIRRDTDGLLACGESDSSLTWMDARVDGQAVTPRIGKPVEIQALWINALRAAADFSPIWASYAAEAQSTFEARFWNPEKSCLYDVIDVDHVPEIVDAACRPNQIFAVGGLPRAVLSGAKARRIVDAVERPLLTPLGLRSLAPGEPGYCARYEGGPRERDSAYHQGTVWPWLMGPFVEAWLRVRPDSAETRAEARRRFLEPLVDLSAGRAAAHIPEIADAEAPHTPRGCPFQAWSVGEALRLDSSCR
jgi:predicted glycogen debranching enzyme